MRPRKPRKIKKNRRFSIGSTNGEGKWGNRSRAKAPSTTRFSFSASSLLETEGKNKVIYPSSWVKISENNSQENLRVLRRIRDEIL